MSMLCIVRFTGDVVREVDLVDELSQVWSQTLNEVLKKLVAAEAEDCL